ncbi:KUP/HAK/KT family potassium transporter [Liquorilactobacillus nagelii]|jgi:KUP system potassium uptake protein|uniref:KUP/HAK/KT family potassium transporter n=1 Tax=Liquorilactobacillus nagelii TaxID=82688 RepID=UPI00242BB1BE|nr:KUP/HAK/KT family potassium transporter [Liquorilactobacillus nagelii]MCI1699645.1 KUP/HAK/KT family potassium transporter [Liquorilactobacillus nagelii]
MKMGKKGRLSLIGCLITLGVVYGDIGTSPLYVMSALLNDLGKQHLTTEYILGCLSLIFWTLMLITTIKYVLIAMSASNKGEGGIFALYALVRKNAKWLLLPALIGGAALLADGTLTPAVTVTSALEGLKGLAIHGQVFVNDQTDVVIGTIIILAVLFIVQNFGTASIGKAFGPIMVLWFGFLAFFGIVNLSSNWGVLRALSPVYGIQLLFSSANPMGIFILGSIFLATTGAEALYSDMGHVGRINIYATWPLVYLALILNYFGQGAWILKHAANQQLMTNPFYQMLPNEFRLPGIILATLAAIIASQALITGSFTLVEEAMGLKLLPHLKITYPSLERGQVYINKINWLLCACTLSIVLYFQSSDRMEAAYGLAITLTMLMTTLLLHNYLQQKIKSFGSSVFLVIFGLIEILFLLASLTKIMRGGYITLLLTLLILTVMIIWYFGNHMRDNLMDESEKVSLFKYRKQLIELSQDTSIPLFMSNVVMLAKVKPDYSVKREVLYSILDKQPKRAKVYWFVTVNTTDEPDTSYYTVDMMGTRNVVNLQLYLGFKTSHQISGYLRQVVNDLINKGAIDKQPQKYTTLAGRQIGDFCFIMIRELLSVDTALPAWKHWLISARIFLQNHSTTPIQWFGLQFSDVRTEQVPLFLKRRKLKKVYLKEIKNSTK